METDRHLITSEDQVFDILATTSYLIVNKQLLETFGPEVSVLLSNLIDKYKYFKENKQLVNGCYFYLLHDEQMEQTGMNLYKVKSCKKVLKDNYIIKTTRIANKEYYKLEAVNILKFISSQTDIDCQPDDIQPPASSISTTNTKDNKAGEKEIYKEKNFDAGRFLEMFPEDWQDDVDFKDALERFVKHRRELNRPLTKQSSTMARNKLVEYPIDTAILSFNVAIEKGYITVFPESAMRYSQPNNTPNRTGSGGVEKPAKTPEQIFGERFSGTYAKQFHTYFVAAQRLLTENSNGENIRLAENMVHLRLYIKQHQTVKAQKNMDIPNPGLLVHQYTNWLEHQDWIDTILPSTYLPDSKLFEKFTAHISSQLRVNVLNGEPKYSVVE